MDILFILKSAILGVVEGLTEFLPVSSTGHLVVFSNLIDFSLPTLTTTSSTNDLNKFFCDNFNMIIQLGAILAVVVFCWQKIWSSIIHLFPSKHTPFYESGLYFWSMVLISCIPAGLIGIPFDDWIQERFFNPVSVACALFVGGMLMIVAEKRLRGDQSKSLAYTTITPRQALIIGLFQVFSIFPGVSRSASTIIGGWVAGLSTVAATEYSFFLAIPIMFGQALLNTIKLISSPVPLPGIAWIALLVGFVVSFIVARLVIGSFLNFLKKKSLSIFAIYRIIFAFFILVYGLFVTGGF